MTDEIKVPVTGDVSGLDRAMDRAEASMTDAARTADRAAGDIGAGFTRVTEHADVAATRFSILGGAVGDVAGGIETFGTKLGLSGEAVAGITAASEGLSTALMFGAGVADIAALSTEILNGANLKSTALKVKDTVATKVKAATEKAAAVGTRVMAASQWALNAALTANPIGLIIVGLVALGAGLVLAYKKSSKFRAVVNGGFAAIKGVAMPVINFLRTAVPKAFDVIISAATFVPRKMLALGGKFLNAGKSLMGKIFEGFAKVGKIGADIGRNLFGGIREGINKAIRGLNNFLPDKIGIKGLPDINLPDNPIPEIPALAKGGIVTGPTLALIGEAGPEAVVPLNGRYGMGGNVYQIHVQAPVGSSPADVGRTLVRYIDAYERAGGRRRAA